MNDSSLKLLNNIAQIIFDKKGFNIIALDSCGTSSITDFVIIAEGSVERHVSSISEAIQDELKKKGKKPFHLEGQLSGDWIALDYSEVIIHLLIPSLREKYQLENLWKDYKIIDLDIDISNSQYMSN